ncbi:hypothetical protein ACFPRL_11120 [Pseudoclavibacter helvolus]
MGAARAALTTRAPCPKRHGAHTVLLKRSAHKKAGVGGQGASLLTQQPTPAHEEVRR